MSLLTYVPSFDDVRALLGVSSDEIEDETIALRVFLRSLEESFSEVDDVVGQTAGTLKSEFLAISTVANSSRTSVEQRFFDNVQSYATYYVASDLADALPIFSPKTISDGKAMIQRHADSPYKLTIEGVRRGVSRSLARLKRAYSEYMDGTVVSSTVVPGTVMLVSVPDTDPVTGS